MAIKQSTEQKILTVLAGHDDWACIGSYYTPWWTTPCLCGHPIKTVFVIGHTNDHGPAYSQPTFNIGSECFKYLLKDPKFITLSEDLQAKRREIEKIQRRMKKMREDEFHATGTWKSLAKRLTDIYGIFMFSSVSSFGSSTMQRAGIDPKSMNHDVIMKATQGRSIIYRITNMDLRFQDAETAMITVENLERNAVEVVEAFRPFKSLLETFVGRMGGVFTPGVHDAEDILERLK